MILKTIGSFLGRLLLGLNALVAILMLLSGFSSYIDPYAMPMLSCAGLAFPVFLLLNLLFFFFWLLFRRKYALFPLVVMFACMMPIRTYFPINVHDQQISDDAIKVLSYNVMTFDGHKPHTKGLNNEIVRYIQQVNADIVCLQEATFNNSNAKKFLSEKSFREAMSAYPYYSHYKERSNGWICLSRYPILSAHFVKYESVGNGSMAYELKVGSDTLLLINNHLESNKLSVDDKAAYREMIKNPEEDKLKSTSKLLMGKLVDAVSIRAAQADVIAKYVHDSKHKYVVVCGDFNDSPLSYAHRVIGEELNDAFIDMGNGFGISFNRNGFYFRIDHIMASDNWQLLHCEVDRSIKASDHYPIWCYMKKK